MATEKIEMSLYKDTIHMTFYPNSHQYKIDGQNILSVTAITGIVDKSWPLVHRATRIAKEYLVAKLSEWEISEQDILDGCGLHKAKKEEAGNIGTQVHDWIEQYAKNDTLSLPIDPKVALGVLGFLDRVKENDVTFHTSERFVYSKNHNYIGILDLIATVNGKKALVDLKTSNKIRMLEYGMQTSAYFKAYEEETGETLDQIIILKLAKDQLTDKWEPIPAFEVQEIVDIDWFYKAFLSAKVLKEYAKKYDTYS